MTNTDMCYARYLTSAICAIGDNLPIVRYIIEVHTVWLHSKPVVITQYFFFLTLQGKPYCQNSNFFFCLFDCLFIFFFFFSFV